MGGASHPPLTPVELRVLHALRQRCPHLAWEPVRVVLCVRDFQPHIDVEEVSYRCADWLMSGQAQRVKDGPATLRAFMERAKASSPAPQRIEPRLAVYDRLRSA